MKNTDPSHVVVDVSAQKDQAEAANDFAITLAQLDKGSSLAELSGGLAQLIQAVRATGRKGKIKYTLEIAPVKNTDGARVECSDDVKIDLPKPGRRPTLFFTTEDGRLTRKDPDQVDWIDDAEKRAAAERAEKARLEGKITKENLAAAVK